MGTPSSYSTNPYNCDDSSLEEADTDGEKEQRKLFFLMKTWTTRKMVIDTL